MKQEKSYSIFYLIFFLKSLKNCSVYLFDHVAQLSVDDCKNCKFFIGPSKGRLVKAFFNKKVDQEPKIWHVSDRS